MTAREMLASMPLEVQQLIKLPPDERLEDDCWPCDPGLGPVRGLLGKAYGFDTDRPHIYIWDRYYGKPVPRKDGLPWNRHHTCETRRCCNPFHMVLITNREHSSIHSMERERQGRWRPGR